MLMKKSNHKYLARIKDTLVYNTNFIIILSFFTLFSISLFIIWYLLKYISENTILIELGNAVDEISKEEITSKYFFVRLFFNVIFVLISILTFVLYGGCKHLVTRKLFGELTNYKEFFKGIKNNFKYNLFAGLVCALFYNAFDLLSMMNISQEWSLIILFIFMLMVFPSIMLFLEEGEVYHGKVMKALKNSVILLLVEWYKTIPLYLFFSVFFAVVFIFNYTIWSYVWFAFLFIYGFGLLEILECNYSLYLFDKYVNKINYPDIYQKGLQFSEQE